MRTTVTLDADVEALLHQRMAERGVSFKQALNDAVRAAIAEPASPRRTSWTRVRSLGPAAVDLDRALAVAGELEDAELVRRMRTGQ